jgi:hypothetical protein
MFDGRRDAERLPIEISHVNWHFLVRTIFFQAGSDELSRATSPATAAFVRAAVDVADREFAETLAMRG